MLAVHPDLAGKLAAAGLEILTDAERATFEKLYAAYVAKHGFPFIIAVKDQNKSGILRAFQIRIANETQAEFQTACTQVERIARLRLEDIF